MRETDTGSLPSRERGLKLEYDLIAASEYPVAPFTGAWIETTVQVNLQALCERRSLHGSVD